MAVCSYCGEQNAPGAQFCAFCNAYLGWREDAPPDPPPPPPPDPTTPDATISIAPDPTDTVIRPRTDPTPLVDDVAAEEGRPFDAAIEVTEATVSVDGTPATVTANVSNTSTVVDSYVLEAVDPPPWLQVRPGRTELLPATGGTVAAGLRIISTTLVPAQQLQLVLRVRNTTGRPVQLDLPMRITVPVVEAPVELHTEPQVIRVRDGAPGMCMVVVKNARSNRWVELRLSADDPEQVVRATWNPPQVQVPPGGEARANVRFDAPPPEPGAEVNRTIKIVASGEHQRAETTVTLAQSTSRAPIELLTLRLEPSVLRLGERRRGQMTAVIDNRLGAGAVNLSLSGFDPEGKMRFTFDPPTLQVLPGRDVSSLVSLTTSRIPRGGEVSRPMTVVASDGRTDIRADGNVIQMVSSPRALARIILTVIGGLAIIVGSLMQFVANADKSAVRLNASAISDEVAASHTSWGIPDQLNAAGAEKVVSIGLILIILGALVILGLTGPTGKMTRRSALAALVITIACVISLSILTSASGPASGAVVVILGCIVGYVGGLLARR